ncbi:MAG: hypothetical protein R2735_16250 [Microthrixaceae bacterium]
MLERLAVLLILSLLLVGCQGGQTQPADAANEVQHGVAVPGVEDDGVGPDIDWSGSPLIGSVQALTETGIAELAASLPYEPLTAAQLGSSVDVYRAGTTVAFVVAQPLTWVIQSLSDLPDDGSADAGLDASDEAYGQAESLGTRVWNVNLVDGSPALVIAGEVSSTVIFRLENSLIQLSAPSADDATDRVLAMANALVAE